MPLMKWSREDKNKTNGNQSIAERVRAGKEKRVQAGWLNKIVPIQHLGSEQTPVIKTTYKSPPLLSRGTVEKKKRRTVLGRPFEWACFRLRNGSRYEHEEKTNNGSLAPHAGTGQLLPRRNASATKSVRLGKKNCWSWIPRNSRKSTISKAMLEKKIGSFSSKISV